MFNLAQSQPQHGSLVVLLHAYTLRPEDMGPIERGIREVKDNVHVVVPSLPVSMFSSSDLSQLSLQLVTEIDNQVQFRSEKGWPEFQEILLIGHSIGALIARKVYVLACGEIAAAPFEESVNGSELQTREWANKVKRLILLAGMNRGWSITHHLNITRAILLSIGAIYGNILTSVFKRRLVIFQIRRGSPFLTQLRLQWLALVADRAKKRLPMPTTIQLLGTVDDLVSPDDNIDLETGRSFLYLDVPYSGHESVIHLDDPEYGADRRKIFTEALLDDEDSIRSRSILPTDPTLAQTRPDISNVVFVIHGIRDPGYWTHKIARKVIGLGQAPPRIYASETAKYGYFPMLPFLLPSRRRQKVEWLMDRYVEAKALYPNATFSYVGHSHGTYLLANAIENYRSCRFDNVVFAGSVIPRNYDWRRALERTKQIGRILNYVATADWVVAWFPGALEKLRLQDVGTGGHNGFEQWGHVDGLYERRYIPGGHGAALAEINWDDIAHFIVNGVPAVTPGLKGTDKRNLVVRGFGLVAPLVWLILAAIVLVCGLGVWRLPSHEWAKTLAVVVYGTLVWRVLTWL